MSKLKEIIKELNDLKIKQTRAQWHFDVIAKKPEFVKNMTDVADKYVNFYREMGYDTAITVIDMGKLGYIGVRHITRLFDGVTYKGMNYTLKFIHMKDITDHTKMFVEK